MGGRTPTKPISWRSCRERIPERKRDLSTGWPDLPKLDISNEPQTIRRRRRTRAKAKSVMTVAEVAEYLRVHRTTIYRLLWKKKIPAFRVGSDWRFNRDSIEAWK